jgi:hypothetical protein
VPVLRWLYMNLPSPVSTTRTTTNRNNHLLLSILFGIEFGAWLKYLSNFCVKLYFTADMYVLMLYNRGYANITNVVFKTNWLYEFVKALFHVLFYVCKVINLLIFLNLTICSTCLHLQNRFIKNRVEYLLITFTISSECPYTPSETKRNK